MSGFPLIDGASGRAIGSRPVIADLRLIARVQLRTGHLPRELALLTMSGIPDGSHRCAVCGEVTTGTLEFCLRFVKRTELHFHGPCHDAWLRERQVRETP